MTQQIDMTTIQIALEDASQKLQEHSSTPKLDASIILEFLLNYTRADLYTKGKETLDKGILKKYQVLLQERQQGKPIAYITQQKDFYESTLFINDNVLIPRPETELLVDLVLSQHNDKKKSILDLGTGSGNIALTLAQQRPKWNITAIDISTAALLCAQKNKQILNVPNVHFLQSDWFQSLPINSQFDIIISNPPYIDENDILTCQHVKTYEPSQALFSKESGLHDLRQIIQQSKLFLHHKGVIYLEHGHQQAKKVALLLKECQYQNIQNHKDLAHIPRVTQAQWKEE